MNKQIENHKFWEFLNMLDKSNEVFLMTNLVRELKVTEEDIFDFISYLDSFDYKIKFYKDDGESKILAPKIKNTVNFELSFVEWLSMQAHFPKMSEDKNMPYHSIIANKLGEIEAKYPKLDMYSSKYEDESNIIQTITKAIIQKNTLNILLFEEENIEIFPHQLVFIDGNLSVLGEHRNDRCLVYFEIKEINTIKQSTDISYQANFGSVEVNDFVMAIRSVDGDEVRLILKVNSMAEGLDLKPEYHLLGKPYITCNMEGDFIWAATVEVSNKLFEWLSTIDNHIEILDPESFKADYEKYLLSIKEFAIAS